MVDSHCHLADSAFVSDLDDVVSRAQAAGLSSALCVLDQTVEAEREQFDRIAELWPEVGCAIGVHPHHAGKFLDRVDNVEEAVLAAIDGCSQSRAIGEIGLDYHYDFAPRRLQQEVFRRQVRLARECDLPVVIHTREADADTVEILRDEGGGAVRGVFHCFTGDVELARQALDLGFYVSFSGILTFKNADTIREAAKVVPDDRLLAETDSPYLAPVPHRGKRNEPAWILRVIEVLSETRRQSAEVVSDATTESFISLFGKGGPRECF